MDKDKVNYGFILAGVSGLFWGFSEFTNDPDYTSSLKRSVIYPTQYSKSNDYKLIYISGPLTSSSSQSLQDELFRVSVQGLKLRRKVEMFQWIQAQDKAIVLNWTASPINSSGFLPHYTNPKWKIFDLDFTAKTPLKVNEYQLGADVLKNLKSWKDVQGEYVGKEFRQEKVQNKLILHKSKKKFTIPKVGNYRVSHEYIPSGIFVSALGMQKGNRLVPYQGKVLVVKEGIVKAENLIDDYCKTSSLYIWKVRATCFIGICLGLHLGLKHK